ncbi:MAG: ATP-binding cassette domain-containing protein [Desulfobacteraceae bacterium]|nr:ATP-binding cassette domain-containing protein [Desulfobacteraceae bacterium]MBU4055726.1 ATP-binding cassette domain-containing protein [Pseudomonadota bacterium]
MHIELNSINFRHEKTDTSVFQNTNYRMEGPGFNALFGPSGVGKTTLAKIIAGETTSFTGSLDKKDISRILYTYNLERLPNWSSIGDHLSAITPASRIKALEEWIEIFGLGPVIRSRYSQLSLGQQNRANLTRYLVQDFDGLIMDESLANVDETTKQQIILKIKREFPDKIFLYISHNVVEVARFCKDILVVRRPAKQPQVIKVPGFDYKGEEEPGQETIEHIMLEIMNAS